ncbi:tumor protein p53-inducible protein 13 [Discoglossus pictus]
MWLLSVGLVLLLCPGGDTLCDNGQFNIQLDIPDQEVYLCTGEHWPLPNQMLQSLVTKYKQENSYHACMDIQIEYAATIPNSGVHRPKLAKYGEYVYCPPQRWVHNLQHGGVAFLYHPCVHPQQKEALSLIARTCMYKHIITPFPSLSRQRPLALAAWCSTLEMSHIDLNEVMGWLRLNVYRVHESELENDVIYQHLLIRPSSAILNKDDELICPKHGLQVLSSNFKISGTRLDKSFRRRRRAASLPASVLKSTVSPVKDASDTSFNASNSNTDIASNEDTSENVSNTQTVVQHPVLEIGITPSPSPTSTVKAPITLAQPQMSDQDPVFEDPSRNTSTSKTESNLPDMPAAQNIPTVGNIAQASVKTTLVPSFVENSRKTTEELDDQGHLQSDLDPSKSQQNSGSHDSTGSKEGETKADQLQKPPSTTDTKLLDNVEKGKPECSCLHESTQHPIDIEEKAPVMGQRKASDLHVSTPRLEEAAWAAASLTFLFVLLTLCVLYTQIYKRFRRSQSLYWAPGNAFNQSDTVASVVKRRLQGQIKRKKKMGYRKSPRENPLVMYESLSESSD